MSNLIAFQCVMSEYRVREMRDVPVGGGGARLAQRVVRAPARACVPLVLCACVILRGKAGYYESIMLRKTRYECNIKHP